MRWEVFPNHCALWKQVTYVSDQNGWDSTLAKGRGPLTQQSPLTTRSPDQGCHDSLNHEVRGKSGLTGRCLRVVGVVSG